MRRFANSSCPVCTHHVSSVLNNLRRCHLHGIRSFAGYSAPRVHQDLATMPSRFLNFTESNPARMLSPCVTGWAASAAHLAMYFFEFVPRPTLKADRFPEGSKQIPFAPAL